MVSRSGLQHAAVTSYAYKLQCLKSQVRQISRERDKARLDLEKAERHCLQLSRELDKQYIALKHSQRKLKDVQTEMEAKELLLQQAINHQVKLEADAQFFQGKEATLHGRLNLMIKENTQLQNKVMEMGEKLTASEKLVLELQKELNLVVKDKLDQEEPHNSELLNHGKYFSEIVLEYERQCQVLWDQNDMLQRELEELRLQLQDNRAERGLLAGEMSITTQQLQEQLQDLKVQLETKVNYYEEEMELMRKTFEREKDSKENVKAEMSKVEDQEEDLKETVSKYQAVTDVMKEQKGVQSLELEERFEMEPARVELQHTEGTGHPRQQLNQEGEELRTQCRNRGNNRGEQGWLLEENSLLKSQPGRLQKELREAKEKCSRHDEKHMNKLSREKVEKLAVAVKLKKSSGKSNVENSQTNIKVSKLSHELLEHEASRSASTGSTQLQNQRLMEVQGVEMVLRPEHCQQHAVCWSEMELLQQQLEASQEEIFEAKASLSLAQTQHALQLQQAKAQLNNVVPRKQFEELQASLREEQCKVQQLQANLQQQAEQACRQLVRTQVSRELQELCQGYQRGSTTSLEWSCGQGHQRTGWKTLYLKDAIDLQIPAAVFIPHEFCHHPVLDQEYTPLLFIYLRPDTLYLLVDCCLCHKQIRAPEGRILFRFESPRLGAGLVSPVQHHTSASCPYCTSSGREGSIMGIRPGKPVVLPGAYAFGSTVSQPPLKIPGCSSSTRQWCHHRSQILHSLSNTVPVKQKGSCVCCVTSHRKCHTETIRHHCQCKSYGACV